MEKKQLNFSAPLMSARQYSSPLRSAPKNKRRDLSYEDQRSVPNQADLRKERDVKSGSVPFLWEQTPGKAKCGDVTSLTSFEDVPSRPKLPPGKKFEELNGFRSCNKLSGELVNELRPQNKVSGEINGVNKFSPLNYVMDQWGKEGSEMNPCSESDDVDEDVAALSISCGVSGLSLSNSPETRHSRTASVEARARDFMIDRFLPAAKAMTLEPYHHNSRKQSGELCREVKASPTRAQTPPRADMEIVPYTGPEIGCEESEYDDRSAISVKIKACWFFPWFFSKTSLKVLNPLPSMKNRSKAFSTKVSNLVKTASLKSPTHKLTKYASCGNHTYKPNPTFKSCELQIPKYSSRPMFYSGELQTRPGSPYRSSRSTSPSRYQTGSPNSRYQKGLAFLVAPKRVEPYDDNRSKNAQNSPGFQDLHRNTRLSGTKGMEVEKNLYMDSVNISKVSRSILNLSKNKKCLNVSRSELGAAYHETFSDGTRSQIMKARGLSFEPDLRRYTSVCGPIPKDDSVGIQTPLTPPLIKSPSDSWLSQIPNSRFDSKLQWQKPL